MDINRGRYELFKIDNNFPDSPQHLIENVRSYKRIGSGQDAVIYKNKLSNINLAIKLGKIGQNEVDIQCLVAKHDIAPKIYAYWKRSYPKETGIIMEEIIGRKLSDFISEENDDKIINIFLNIIETIFYLNIELQVNHNDLHHNNIIITHDYKIIIIDFGSASQTTDYNLEDYKKFMREFYGNIKWNVGLKKKSYDSDTNRLFRALKDYKKCEPLSFTGYDTTIYKNFKQIFLKYLPPPSDINPSE